MDLENEWVVRLEQDGVVTYKYFNEQDKALAYVERLKIVANIKIELIHVRVVIERRQ